MVYVCIQKAIEYFHTFSTKKGIKDFSKRKKLPLIKKLYYFQEQKVPIVLCQMCGRPGYIMHTLDGQEYGMAQPRICYSKNPIWGKTSKSPELHLFWPTSIYGANLTITDRLILSANIPSPSYY